MQSQVKVLEVAVTQRHLHRQQASQVKEILAVLVLQRQAAAVGVLERLVLQQLLRILVQMAAQESPLQYLEQ